MEKTKKTDKWVLCCDNETGEFFIILGENIAAKCEFSSIIEVFNNAFLAYSAREKLMEGVKSDL